jgi:hypothetical protein
MEVDGRVVEQEGLREMAVVLLVDSAFPASGRDVKRD